MFTYYQSGHLWNLMTRQTCAIGVLLQALRSFVMIQSLVLVDDHIISVIAGTFWGFRVAICSLTHLEASLPGAYLHSLYAFSWQSGWSAHASVSNLICV